MLRLLMLENKKIRSRKIMAGMVLLFLLLLFLTEIAIQASVQDNPRNSYQNIIRVEEMVATEVFCIFGGVLVCVFVLREYSSGTAKVMLSYPIRPELWIGAKLLLAAVWTSVGTLIGNILCLSYVVIRDRFGNIVVGSLTQSSFHWFLFLTGISVVMNCLMVLNTLAVGMIQKLITAAMVAAVVEVVVLQVIYSQCETMLQYGICILFLAGASIAFCGLMVHLFCNRF